MSVHITHRVRLVATAIVLGLCLTSVAAAEMRDGRSPDTKDAATLIHRQIVAPTDGRSPDTRDAANTARADGSTVDLRSPDTRDAAVAAHAPSIVVLSSGGFDWTDAGIGAVGGFAIALLAGGGIVLLRGNRGKLAL